MSEVLEKQTVKAAGGFYSQGCGGNDFPTLESLGIMQAAILKSKSEDAAAPSLASLRGGSISVANPLTLALPIGNDGAVASQGQSQASAAQAIMLRSDENTQRLVDSIFSLDRKVKKQEKHIRALFIELYKMQTGLSPMDSVINKIFGEEV